MTTNVSAFSLPGAARSSIHIHLLETLYSLLTQWCLTITWYISTAKQK